MKIKRILILLILLISVNFNCLANTSAAQKLTVALKNIQTLSADFEQTITSQTAKTFSRSKGFLKIQRPGKFLWETKSPNAMRVVADGKNIWTYDIDLEQIIKQDAKSVLLGSPAELLSGKLVNLEKDFTVKQVNDSLDKSVEKFILKPKAKDFMLQGITLNFRANQLSSMEIQDALGQRINTSFTKVNLNSPLNSKIFIFIPPAGVDIINH